MSFSPFEDFLEFSDDASNLITTNNDEPSESSTTQSGSNGGLYETTILSSRDSGSVLSFTDTMSIDSDTLQEFGSIVTLPPGTLAGLIQRNYGQNADNADSEENTMSTIVSSAPSQSYIPAPEASQDIWAICPHPSFVPSDHINTLSTVCTDTLSYQRLLGDATSVVSAMNDDDSMSAPSVQSIRIVVHSPEHERATFEAIANQLLRDVSGDPKSSGRWYSRFTDFDWDQLREVARVVLASTGPAPKFLPLPPSPPVDLPQLRGFHVGYIASELLPSNFVCPCCKDVLVGALALDCGCTVCAGCWDGDSFLPSEVLEQEDYVWVDQRRCNGCRRMVHSTIPCQALDVAVFQIMEKLDPSQRDDRIQSMKVLYYSRLGAWRQTVLAKNDALSKKQALQEDEMLARLIQEEEDVIWDKEHSRDRALSNSTRTLLVIGQAAVALFAATLSSVALKAVFRRR